jgi:hypothetical protein
VVAERGHRHFRELDFPWTCHGGAKHIDPPGPQNFAWAMARRGQEQRIEVGIGIVATPIISTLRAICKRRLL